MSNVVDKFGNASSLLVNAFNGALITEGSREKIEDYHTAYYPSTNNLGEYTQSVFQNGIDQPTATVNKNSFVYYPNVIGTATVNGSTPNRQTYVDMSSAKFRNCSHLSVHINSNNFTTSTNGGGPKAYPVLIGWNDVPGTTEPPIHPYFNALDTTGEFYNLGCLVHEAFDDSEATTSAEGGMFLTAVATNDSETAPQGGPDGNNTRIWKVSSRIIPIQFKYYALGIANFGAAGTGNFKTRVQFTGVS
tara:strand:- start:609 stop:1349 length:741 start_codon:yes stop_codon:yes gene_type:complete